MRTSRSAIAILVLGSLALWAEVRPPRPGWNIFSKDQDIQLGQQAAAEIEKKYQVVSNPEVNAYIQRLGARLVRSRYAGDFPYTFKVVADDSINAFALPGGPMFIHTGLILAADNEAQLAGVMGHEISHVALRHGTNQASKANALQLPAALAGGALGGGSLGQLAQLGIGVGANSVLLKFSRTAESQADYNGTLILADAGYNAIELARFFEKLEAEKSQGSRVSAFFSSHPNPGDRGRAIQDLVRQLPRRDYTTENPELQRVQAILARMPNPKRNATPAPTSSSGRSRDLRSSLP